MSYSVPRRGLVLVSFDSGGPGTVSQLRILREVMGRLAWDLNDGDESLRPSKYIDLMGGTGWGGFCALLLGRLGMSVEEAMSSLSIVGQAVFPLHGTLSNERRSRALKVAIESVLEQYGLSTELPLLDSEQPQDYARCKVVVYAQPTITMGRSQEFRTYRSGYESELGCTFVEAACAILSSPQFFEPMKIGPLGRENTFIGPPYTSYNPAGKLLLEAGRIFPKEFALAMLLSLGAGQPHLISLNRDSNSTTLVQIAEDCDTIDEQITHRLPKLPAYLRLSVDKGLEDYRIAHWHRLGDVIARTQAYVNAPGVSQRIDEGLRMIFHGRRQLATLKEINGPTLLNQSWQYFSQ